MADDHRHPPLPQPAPEVMCQRFDDGAVLFSTRTEVYYQLNEVGATVWEQLGKANDLDALCGEVGRRHPGTDAAVVRREVAALLEELAGEGLLALRAGADDGRQGP